MSDQVAKTVQTRDAMRAKLLATHQLENRKMNLFGIDVEIRQPEVDVFMDIFGDEESPRNETLPRFLIMCAYVPGTQEKVFEMADMESLKKWPYGKEIRELQKYLNEIVGVSLEEAKDDIKKSR